nr:hypothetical protein [Tanacetum cinerariifolium]
MTGNISYLSEYEPFNEGYVSFGHERGKITAKGSIKTDKSMLWHKRLGHLNFKTMNKLVRSNLVKGLPSKRFKNEHSCVACLKGKHHKASCKSKLVNFVSKPLYTLHMDLFGPTPVSSLNHKWILRNFITEIENIKDLNVKIIKSDNGGEFRNKKMDELCSVKGIKRDFSNATTPQQNGVAKRRNRTLIEAARTMLADAKLPVTFWGEAENLHVDFLENRSIEKGTGPDWLFDIDTLINSMNYVPVVVAETSSTNILAAKKDDVIPDNNNPQKEQEEVNGDKEVPESSRNSNLTASTKVSPNDSFELASSSTVETKVPTVSTLVPTDSLFVPPVISSVLRIISMGGSSYPEPLSLGNAMSFENRLKDLFGDTSDAVSLNDVEADLSNMDTDIQVSPTPTLRIHKDHPKSQIIGPIDTPHPGFQDPEFPHRVYKVEKAMYGLHQAPKAWYGTLSKYLLDKGFQRECHLHAVKRSFRYLKGHPKLGLWYPKESPFDLVAYSDSDYGGVNQDRKSTTGDDNVVDLLTKAFDVGRFQYLVGGDSRNSANGLNRDPVSKVRSPGADETAFPTGDVRCGEAFPTVPSFDAGQDRENIAKTSAMPHEASPRVTSLGGEERRIGLRGCSKHEGGVHKGEDLLVGDTVKDSNKSADKGSDNTDEMANVLGTLGAANILASRDSEIAKIHAERELEMMITKLDWSNEMVEKYLSEYEQAKAGLLHDEKVELIDELLMYQRYLAQIKKYQAQQNKPATKTERRNFYMSILRSNAGWKAKDFKGMTFEQIEEKIIPLDKESFKKLKTAEASSTEPTQEQQSEEPKELSEEELKKIMELVQVEELYIKALQVKYPIINWEIYSEGQRSTTEVTNEKEKELWVELKRLYEPDSKDQLWVFKDTYMIPCSVMKLTTGRMIDGSSCVRIDMVIKDLDLEPKIDAMLREFLDPSRWKELSKKTSSKILLGGDGSCRKTFKPIASLIRREN